MARSHMTPLKKPRSQVAALIGAEPDEIVFTGGGSEASNQAIKGTCLGQSCHIITTAVEHPATLKPIEFLRRLGCTVTIVPVDRFGMVDPDDVRKAIKHADEDSSASCTRITKSAR